MSWKIALVVALITGLITAVVTFPVAEYVARANGVSDREGARSMGIFFFLVPIGLVGGLLFGLLGTKLVHATEWVHFWKATGASVFMAQVALFVVAGFNMLEVPRAPQLDGQLLVLEVEVQVPMSRITPGSFKPDQVLMSLYTGPKDNNYATIDSSLIHEENGKLHVTGFADLNSRSAMRMLSFSIDNVLSMALDPLPVAAKPTSKDMEWTALMPMRESELSGTDYIYTDVLVRMRVVKRAQAA